MSADEDQVVALYDFDPSTVDWPFPTQGPLAIRVSQIIQIIHDDGGGWALGHLKGQPEARGYFPKNYTMGYQRYAAMMREFEVEGQSSRDVGPDRESRPEPTAAAGPGAGVGRLGMPGGGARPAVAAAGPAVPGGWAGTRGAESLAVVAARDPWGGSSSEATGSRMVRSMLPVPELSDDEMAARDDDILHAQREVERELATITDTSGMLAGGDLAASRCSTPATEGQTRPERDFVRSHVPMRLQGQYLRPVSDLANLVPRARKKAWDGRPAFNVDMRVRAATVRMAKYMRPSELRLALATAAKNGGRWTQMFKAGFNDIVNESFRSGNAPYILSEFYNGDAAVREKFQKIQNRDVNGILWFELQRRKDAIYYTNIDYVDVMMTHPHAWGFPDAMYQVSANPGEPVDPFHGWMSQKSVDLEKEIEDVDFLYTLRLRAFPERTFQALSLGKIPEWVDPFKVSHFDEAAEQDKARAAIDQGIDDKGKARKSKFQVDDRSMMSAGINTKQIYVKVGPDGVVPAPHRVLAPDVLDAKMIPFRIKGVSAMRIFMRSRGNPDNVKQSLITPKMVKDMAAQLGIRQLPSAYWYCLFALRYPLAPEWEAVVRDDTRWYLHMPSDKLQPIHPMIKRFREHLEDCLQNEFLWEFREPPVVKFKCAECGLPDSIVWCMQCTDYFCAPCFFEAHRTTRGKKHWPMPVPGSRYLTASESARLRDHLPLLNVGFSNRRRFLARDNQSDKNGSRQGDTWLFFHADTFQAALQQAPEKHWFLKRLKPPRLAPGVEGYYYNFANDVVADDASHILTKAHEQKALSILQKNMRGAITRRRIKKEAAAVRIIQGAKRMWDVRKVQGKNGGNAVILRRWYGKHKAKHDNLMLDYRIARVQACFAGYEVRRDFFEMLHNVRKFQANFRGLRARRKFMTMYMSGVAIQRYFRGRIYGRLPRKEMRQSAGKIQGLVRGVQRRELEKKWARSVAYIQAHVRGMLGRKRVKLMHRSGIMIQANWRRFQAQLTVKIILYDRLAQVRKRRLELVREKLEDSAALLIQRNFRRHHDYKRLVLVRREKFEADKRTSTLLVAMFAGAAALRHFVHPFFRHLPSDIQEVLTQIKASMQRTIGLVPVTGKLANEEIGRRGLRVAGKENLYYDQSGRDDIDLATHLLLSVSRHLLPQLPDEQFAPTVKWACYSMGHHAVALDRTAGCFPREVVPVGKDPTLPPHPGDSLSTFFDDVSTIKHHHDWLMSLPEESMPLLILHGLPERQRQIYLTAQVLVTMRQALDAPSISTDDHLRFQGLDAAAGSQLMEVLGCELDHRVPLDWPKMYGTVSALANQASVHVMEQKTDAKKKSKEDPVEEKDEKKKGKEVVDAVKGASKAKAKAAAVTRTVDKVKGKAAPKKAGDKLVSTIEEGGLSMTGTLDVGTALPELPVGGHLSHFNRHAALRIVQQLGYYMCDQDTALQAVLSHGATLAAAGGVRQSRYISVIDKLFEMADRAKHDHCSFVLSVVLFHMVLRALMLRVLYHRAAIAIQKRYRYLRSKGIKARTITPTIRIQRFWRGLCVALRLAKMDDAAEKIQNSYRAWRWNRRSSQLLKATLRIQRFWHSTVHRAWIRKCHDCAKTIQRFARGMLTRWVLDRIGRELVRNTQAELSNLLKRKSSMTESFYIARSAVVAGRGKVALHQHRQRNIEKHRMESLSTRNLTQRQMDKSRRLRMLGSIQPARDSVFEPMIFALLRLDSRGPARYGLNTRVQAQIADAKRKLTRYLPPRKKRVARFHVSSLRGRAALLARRLCKKAPRTQMREATETVHVLDDGLGMMEEPELQLWMRTQFAVKK